MKLDAARLHAALGSGDLAWLLKRLRRRYETGGDVTGGVLRLHNPSPRQREACDRLLGRRPGAGGSLTVQVDQLERIVVAGELAPSLRDAVEALTGPLIDRRSELQRKQAAWQKLYERFRPAVEKREATLQWYEQVWKQGVLRRLSGRSIERAAVLLDQAVRVVERLPAGGVTLAQLAAECCGDSHALDAGQPVGTLTVRAAAKLGGVEQRRTTSARRRAWDAVGVICDELSAPVLALNLPAVGTSLTDRLLGLCAQAGEPCRITARQLLRHPPTFDANVLGGDVYVCENASVVAAAADVTGTAGHPLVCIDGQPTTAATLLLNLLGRTGVTLRYHGDFDWGGVRIANRIITNHHAQPWRMLTDDYLAAVVHGGRSLRGRVTVAAWDHRLSAVMSEWNTAVHEERVLSSLLDDLRSFPVR